MFFLAGLVVFMGSRCSGSEPKEGIHTVTSEDGTKIAYDKSGKGPAVILISGALVNRSAHAGLAKVLSTDFTVYNFDRRGRGDSGDTKPYSVAREVEDIEALIENAGGSAYVYGISSGACLALEAAAALGNKVEKLAVYEAPYDESEGASEKWAAYHDQLNELVAADRRDAAVEYHMKFVGVPDSVITAMKASPDWSGMKVLAPTILYDIAVVGVDRSVPVDRAATITATTLVMDGGASLEIMPFMRASADKIASTVPNAGRHTIEGQGHNVADDVVGKVLKDFFGKKD